MRPAYHITIPIYPGVDLLDVAAPFELFNWMASLWKGKAATVSLAGESLSPLKTRDGLVLTPDVRFEDFKSPHTRTDLLWVPGGDPAALKVMMKGGAYLDFIRQQSDGAAYITSVCEGALLLAAAGLLDGFEATTHWAFLPCLREFPRIKVSEGFPRYVVDRNRVTGGGISSGLDEALKVISIIAGNDIAKQVQLTTQYFPEPPFAQSIVPATTCPLSD